MDDLISHLRSSQKPKSKKDQKRSDTVKSSLNPDTLLDPFETKEGEPIISSNLLSNEKHSRIENNADDSYIEPTSSQGQVLLQINKFDFNKLRKVKLEHSSNLNSMIIKSLKDYVIEGTYCGIVKRMERFGNEVVNIELVDEEGTIFGSCPYSIFTKIKIKIGSILILQNCSLWKVGDNHFNIAERNIVGVK